MSCLAHATAGAAQEEEKPAKQEPAPTQSAPPPPPAQQQGQQPPPYPYPYPPPPGYYPVPYYVPVYEPPPPWKPGDPAPPGYHVETRVDMKTVRSGVSMLVGFWIISVITGAVLNEAEEERAVDGDDVEPGDWTPLYIPIAGPFLVMDNVTTEDAGWALLLLDGIFQSVGAIGIVVGLASREEYLERNSARRPAPRVSVVPLVGPRATGVGFVGNF